MESAPASPAQKRERGAARAPISDCEAQLPVPNTSSPNVPSQQNGAQNAEGGEEEDEDRMDVAFIQGFADKIQRLPAELLEGNEHVRTKITIPKRGEKDFGPLQETVNLQEMMLQSSRQALFDALQGVRGVSGKALSHAIITPASPFPQLIVSRGHVLDTLGITVRRALPFSEKPIARVELLPEEAMYLAERGSLQIWNGRDPGNEDELKAGVGAWCDEEFGVKGAIEMSVMEVFGRFMGKEGLTWQRYQAYAYLKRLGYTVQRSRQFIPAHFLAPQPCAPVSSRRGWGTCIFTASIKSFDFVRRLWRSFLSIVSGTCHTFLGLPVGWSRPLKQTVLSDWTGHTYGSLFTHLRFVPAGHANAIAEQTVPTLPSGSTYDSLIANPYLPFFHVWKPVTNWSKIRWDKGSPKGLSQQKPDYTLAVVESRNTPMPTITQLDEVFQLLPDEPQAPTRRVGPQYDHKRPSVQFQQQTALSWWRSMWQKLVKPVQPARTGNAVNALRNGDRALIVAVNDSGNTGWVRFGRTGFAAVEMI